MDLLIDFIALTSLLVTTRVLFGVRVQFVAAICLAFVALVRYYHVVY